MTLEIQDKNKDEFKTNAYSLFVLAINSPVTKGRYISRLDRFFKLSGVEAVSFEEKCKIFADKAKNNSDWLSSILIKFVQIHKERVEKKELSGATIRNYLKSIKLFCEMNDILFPWKKITRGLPKGKKYADDRAPTISEVQRLVEYPDRRIKSVVTVMLSSGIRVGAWDYLRWKHIHPIIRNEQVIAARIDVYAGEEESYFSFITPEAFHEVKKWILYRKDSGENINDESWIMRNIWNSSKGRRLGIVKEPKKLQSTGVKRLVETALWTQGLRQKLKLYERRHEFQADHGFRKMFKTRCELSGMKPINIEILMGHSVGISDSYYRATENELLDDYLKAVDFLAISKEYELSRHINEVIKETNDNYVNLKSTLYDKEKAIVSLSNINLQNSDAIAALADKVEELVKEIDKLKNTQN